MSWCLLPKHADALKADIISGKIDPQKLADMSSAERHTFFEERFGKENAAQMNRLLETKFLLKNQQQGYINWANGLLVPKEVKRDIVSRIERMDKVLDAKDEQAFLKELASHRLGTGVSFEEATKINELSKKIRDVEKFKGSDNLDERLEYGRAVVDLANYTEELKKNAQKLTLSDLRNRPVATSLEAAGRVPGILKSIQAAFDNSAIFRQGWKTLWTHPGVWAKNSLKSFKHLVTLHGQERVMNEVNADIVSRPNYDLMRKAKLDVGNMEEAYPTSLPEKVPVIGRVYKATENAYTAFVRKTRADVFDKYIDIANRSGVELSNTELVQIGRMVNALTGRGNLGKLERAGQAINTVFFSPKFFKAHIDTLMQPLTGGASLAELGKGETTGSNFVRKQAAINLAKTVAATAAIMVIAKALKPDSVETDPTSADFGKIRIGNTRFDVTGGMGSLAVLASRLASGKSKSSTTGKVTDLSNPKFGESNRQDVLVDFFGNKLSPVGQIIGDVLKGKTFDGQKPTVGGEALSAVTPLPVKNAIEVWQDPTADNVLKVSAILADALGISTNTYSAKPKAAKKTKPKAKRPQ